MTHGSIWVDADACPKVIRDILYRAVERTGVTVTLVANQALLHPRIPSLRLMQVSSGFDVADHEIVKCVSAGDLVITADIPLAAEVIAKGGEALNPRGERYSPDTIRGVLISGSRAGYETQYAARLGRKTKLRTGLITAGCWAGILSEGALAALKVRRTQTHHNPLPAVCRPPCHPNCAGRALQRAAREHALPG